MGKRPPGLAVLAPPRDLRASRVAADGDEYLLLSYPLPDWDLPAILSLAEKDVARALLAGAAQSQIARVRGTSSRTVANQIASVFRKLRVTSRMELAARYSGGESGLRARGD
jgi:DNA-binding CsgD family transcriptional regulator